MSREILFKAKDIDTGEWVEGSLVHYKAGKKHFIITDKDFQWGMCKSYSYDGDFTEIDETTICQYTGLTDKNGNKIWENDLIECKEFSDGQLIKHFLSQVEWDDFGTGFEFKDSKHGWVFMDSLTVYECEVIGNVFDNPKLVKGSEENG